MSFELIEIFVSKSQEERLYQMPCPVIGLTGGIATGKSSVTKILEDKGLSVICADKLVKSIYATDEAKEFIQTNFSFAIKENEISFSSLREEVFGDEEKKKQVETFIYSKMPEAFKAQAASFNNPSVLIYDVPLLFEKGLDSLVDVSVCVYCPREVQKERLLKRDNSSEELAEKILSSQLNIEDKKAKSDFVINNSGEPSALEQKVDEFLALVF